MIPALSAVFQDLHYPNNPLNLMFPVVGNSDQIELEVHIIMEYRTLFFPFSRSSRNPELSLIPAVCRQFDLT